MKPVLNLPNIITATRIILTPVFIVLLVSGDGVLIQCSAAVFLVAAITDWYDGWYARRYNVMSAFGRFFDPLADKVLTSAAFFAFAFLGMLPLWMVIIIVGRDVLITILRVVADLRRQPVVTSRLAKFKTALQLVFLWYLVVVFTLQNVGWLSSVLDRDFLLALTSDWIIYLTLGVLVLLSILTAVLYLIANRHLLRVLFHGNVARTTP
jgi:CDP-diacylglycerol--glycerol-3-phosphate 3-phosphatidyltransferase